MHSFDREERYTAALGSEDIVDDQLYSSGDPCLLMLIFAKVPVDPEVGRDMTVSLLRPKVVKKPLDASP